MPSTLPARHLDTLTPSFASPNTAAREPQGRARTTAVRLHERARSRDGRAVRSVSRVKTRSRSQPSESRSRSGSNQWVSRWRQHASCILGSVVASTAAERAARSSTVLAVGAVLCGRDLDLRMNHGSCGPPGRASTCVAAGDVDRVHQAATTTSGLLARAARSTSVLATTPLEMHEAVLSPPTYPLI